MGFDSPESSDDRENQSELSESVKYDRGLQSVVIVVRLQKADYNTTFMTVLRSCSDCDAIGIRSTSTQWSALPRA